MIPQLPLALRWPRRQRFEHFHAGANAAALAAVEVLAREPDAPWLYLHGPAGSGKSHLLMAACQAAGDAGHGSPSAAGAGRAGAAAGHGSPSAAGAGRAGAAAGRGVQYLPLARIADRAAAIRGVAGGALLAFDDLDAIAGEREAEHALFDLYNRAKAEGTALLFAADAVPTQLGLNLPDLRSRLGACTRFALQPLDDAERREVLKAQAGLRGIELDEGVLDWLFARHTRDLGALLDLLDKLDQASLAAQRRVTIPFLRTLLREAGASTN